MQYERTTGRIVLDRQGRVERIQFSAVMRVIRDGKPAERITPSHDFYRSRRSSTSGPVGRFFEARRPARSR